MAELTEEQKKLILSVTEKPEATRGTGRKVEKVMDDYDGGDTKVPLDVFNELGSLAYLAFMDLKGSDSMDEEFEQWYLNVLTRFHAHRRLQQKDTIKVLERLASAIAINADIDCLSATSMQQIVNAAAEEVKSFGESDLVANYECITNVMEVMMAELENIESGEEK